MSSGHRILTVFLTVICLLVLTIAGLATDWPRWFWPALGATALIGTVAAARAGGPRGGRIPPEYDEAHAVARRIEAARAGAPERLCHNDLLNANFIDASGEIIVTPGNTGKLTFRNLRTEEPDVTDTCPGPQTPEVTDVTFTSATITASQGGVVVAACEVSLQ